MNGNIFKFEDEAYRVLSGYCGTPHGHIVIPDGVTHIASRAFFGCAGITALTLPEGLSDIGALAFSGTSLGELTVPDSVEVIGSCALPDSCQRLILHNASTRFSKLYTEGEPYTEECDIFWKFDYGIPPECEIVIE